MIHNELYDSRLKKVKDCIKFENEHVVSTFMGQSTPPAFYDDITLAEYMTDAERGLDLYIDFMNRINAIAPIDCTNFAYPGAHQAALTMAWWSHLKMPGKELPPDSVWQVVEKERMKKEDYDTIIKEGPGPVADRILKETIEPEELDKFFEFYVRDFGKNYQKYADAGYPVLNSGIVCPPFETLCGGRSMGKFFMDCYKDIDKVKAAQDAMMPGLKAQIDSIQMDDYVIGAWVGGWRGASNMVSRKIWDTLVWPYMKQLAEWLLEKGITPILHLDACWDRDLEHFLELPAKKCIMNTDGMTDLRRARKILGDHMAFMGDVPSQMLTVSSAEEIKDYVRNLLNDIGPQGVFITAGCDAPSCSKYENLVAIQEAAQEF